MQLILLPGMDGTGILFKPLIEKLPKSLSTTVISYPLDDKLSYQDLVFFVKEYLPENENYIIVAESYSGPIAYLLAQEQPERLKLVIFVASFLKPPIPVLLKLLSIFPLEKLLDVKIPSFITRYLMLGAKIDKETLNLFNQTLEQVSGTVLAKRFREIARLSCELKSMHIRSVYIQATNDKLVSSQNVDVFKQCCNELSVFRVPGPHFILQANPEDCARIIVNETEHQTRN